jgi:hypothetical protein
MRVVMMTDIGGTAMKVTERERSGNLPLHVPDEASKESERDPFLTPEGKQEVEDGLKDLMTAYRRDIGVRIHLYSEAVLDVLDSPQSQGAKAEQEIGVDRRTIQRLREYAAALEISVIGDENMGRSLACGQPQMSETGETAVERTSAKNQQ